MEKRLTSDQMKEFENLLIQLAKIELRVVSYFYSWEEKRALDLKKDYGIFSRKKIEKEIKNNMETAFKLQEKLRKIYSLEQEENVWWNVPCNLILKYILLNIHEMTEDAPWRYEYHWELNGNGNERVLILNEEGHMSNFKSERFSDKKIDSVYSDTERVLKMYNFQEKERKRVAKEKFWDDGRLVRSLDSGEIYKSKEDYFDSFEYHARARAAEKIYEYSLGTEHVTHTYTMVSNSMHYFASFEVGTFIFSNPNELWAVKWHPYQLINHSKDIPEDLQDKYKNRDPGVSCAAFLHNYKEIHNIPVAIFEETFTEPLKQPINALQLAAILVCMGDKLC